MLETWFLTVPSLTTRLSISGGSFTSMASGGGSSVLGKPVQITLQTIGDTDALNQFSLELEQKLKVVPIYTLTTSFWG